MGIANPNWDRWIISSVVQDFDAWNKARSTPYPKYVEGEERKTNREQSWLELRFDGPSKFQYSKDFWKLELEINVLCSAGVDLDLFHINKMVGDVSSWFKVAFCVYKYGDTVGVDDPSVFVGTLQQTKIDRHNLLVRQYGQIEAKTKLNQATVAANYFIDIP